MRQRKSTAGQVCEQWLNISKHRLAGGGISDVPDRAVAGQPLHHRRLCKAVAHQSHAALGIKLFPIGTHDPGGLLSPVLKRLEAKRNQSCGILVAEYPKHTALLPQFVPSPVCIFCELGRGVWLVGVHTLSFAALFFIHDPSDGVPPYVMQV